MKFKRIEFKDKNAQRVYDNYINDIKEATKTLDAQDRDDVLMEFNSHIYESMQHGFQTDIGGLLNAIEQLGVPQEVLKPLIADKLLDKATKSFNPIDVVRALAINIGNGIGYIIFCILYLSLGTFIFLIVAKLFKGDKVGLFFKDGVFKSLGYNTYTEGYTEVLGYWFIPIMLLSMVFLYLLITFLLRIKKTIHKK